MTGILHFETFLFAGILLNLTPGNDTIFILAKSIGEGKKAGIVSSLGIATGSVGHTIFATFGLSIIISNSLWLFLLIKYLGAAYLLFIGIKMLTNKSLLNTGSAIEPESTNYLKIYRDGFFTNILNPKVALFFIAFLPQFIDSTHQNTILPFLLLGATFIATGTIWCMILAIFASYIFQNLKNNKKASIFINRFCGMILIGLALKVVFLDKK